MTAHLDAEALVAKVQGDPGFGAELPPVAREALISLIRDLPVVLAPHLDAVLTNTTYLEAKIAVLRHMAEGSFCAGMSAAVSADDLASENKTAEQFEAEIRGWLNDHIMRFQWLLDDADLCAQENPLGAVMLEIACSDELADVLDAHNNGTLTVTQFVQADPEYIIEPEA